MLMIMEKLKIIIPTDFSVQAEFAYLMVQRLEEKTAIDIHFLHVLNVPDTVTLDAKGNVQTCGEIDINPFHQSATEKFINHLFKPIISFQLNN